MRTLLFLLAFAPLTLAAQPITSSAPLALAVSTETHTPDGLIGTYVTRDATLYVGRSGQRLVLTLAGQPAFDAFAGRVASAPAFNARAEALLRDAFDGRTDRLSAALPGHLQQAGTQDFARLLSTLVEEHGQVSSIEALGTLADDDIAETFVRVRFADGEELLKLKWRDGALALITRGSLPQVTAYPVRGSIHRFAVLNAEGEPTTLLVFADEQMTARGSESTLVAARAF